jgi:tetratricopeptide (TPR) repeat protein
MESTKIQNTNDTWIIHREEIETALDGVCDIYVLIDAANGHCLGQEISKNLPSSSQILNLLKKACFDSKAKPKNIFILKKDPLSLVVEEIAKSLNISFKALTQKEIHPYTKDFSEGFKQFKYNQQPNFEEEDVTQEELKAFVPETYGPCPCASGKKYKFCCQKTFKEITFAMCEAQEGNLDKALFHMKLAEEKMGLTAEILCRYAICWSFYDQKKFKEYLKKALAENPNHPRSNYIMGIESVAKKKYSKGIEFYQKAISNYPSEDRFHLNETYTNMGTAYFELGNFVMAKESWEKALVNLPTDRKTKENLVNFIYQNPVVPKAVREVSPFIKKYLTGNKH